MHHDGLAPVLFDNQTICTLFYLASQKRANIRPWLDESVIQQRVLLPDTNLLDLLTQTSGRLEPTKVEADFGPWVLHTSLCPFPFNEDIFRGSVGDGTTFYPCAVPIPNSGPGSDHWQLFVEFQQEAFWCYWLAASAGVPGAPRLYRCKSTPLELDCVVTLPNDVQEIELLVDEPGKLLPILEAQCSS